MILHIQSFKRNTIKLVETTKTNPCGYLHISFQIGPQGEIKKSSCLDIVCPDGSQCLSRLSVAALVQYSLWLTLFGLMQNGAEYRGKL